MYSKFLSRRRANFQEEIITAANAPSAVTGIQLPDYFKKAIYVLDYQRIESPESQHPNAEETKQSLIAAMESFRVETKNFFITPYLPNFLKSYAEAITQILMVLVYYLVGIWFYHAEEGWTLLECCYFITSTITTIGLGDYAPYDEDGKLFTIFYALSGLVIVYAIVSARVVYLFMGFERAIMDRVNRLERIHAVSKLVIQLILFSSIFLVILFLFAGIYELAEYEWSFVDALYFCSITMASIGYGDMTVSKGGSQVLTIIFMLLAVTSTVLFVEKVGMVLYELRQIRKRDRITKLENSAELILKFNPNGKVTAVDFLVSILTYANIVDKERDIEPILRKFIELDKNKDGILDKDDLLEFIQQFQQAKGASLDGKSEVELLSIIKDDVLAAFGSMFNRTDERPSMMAMPTDKLPPVQGYAPGSAGKRTALSSEVISPMI